MISCSVQSEPSGITWITPKNFKDRELLFFSHRKGDKADIKKKTISSWLIQTIHLALESCSEESSAMFVQMTSGHLRPHTHSDLGWP
jgi:hypothetical protein